MTLIPIYGRAGVVAHAIVDDADAALVMTKRWHLDRDGAVWSHDNPNRTTIKMHRLITGAKKGQDVDHINHNRLDNQRSNLRVCTHAENMMNIRPRPTAGVRFAYGSWRARLTHRGREIHVGSFETREAAIAARSAKIIELRGAFAAKEYTHV